MNRTVKTAVVGLALAALLSGCASSTDDAGSPQPEPSGVATDVAASPETSSTPSPAAPPSTSPTPSATPTTRPASIPTDCTDLVDAATYAATMGDAPLNDPAYFGQPMGQVTPTAPAADSDPREVVSAGDVLRCGWADVRADITGLFADVSTVDAATASAYPAWLAEKRESTSPFWLDGVVYDCTRLWG